MLGYWVQNCLAAIPTWQSSGVGATRESIIVLNQLGRETSKACLTYHGQSRMVVAGNSLERVGVGRKGECCLGFPSAQETWKCRSAGSGRP
jgi:hypothetical protein